MSSSRDTNALWSFTVHILFHPTHAEMFCSSLRKRREWVSVPPELLSQQQWRWEERALETHDFAIPLPRARQQDPQEVFRLLLLSSVDIQPPEKSLGRIERLYQAGGRHVGIMFLLREKDSQDDSSGTRAFMSLQASLLSSGNEMPIVPICTSSSLQQTLFVFHRQILQLYSKPPSPQINSAIALLPYCSVNSPIPEHERNVLSDICQSIPLLAQAATTPDGQRALTKWLTELSPQLVAGIIGFWEQEYIVD